MGWAGLGWARVGWEGMGMGMWMGWDGWMDAWLDGWTDGWLVGCVRAARALHTCGKLAPNTGDATDAVDAAAGFLHICSQLKLMDADDVGDAGDDVHSGHPKMVNNRGKSEQSPEQIRKSFAPYLFWRAQGLFSAKSLRMAGSCYTCDPEAIQNPPPAKKAKPSPGIRDVSPELFGLAPNTVKVRRFARAMAPESLSKSIAALHYEKGCNCTCSEVLIEYMSFVLRVHHSWKFHS